MGRDRGTRRAHRPRRAGGRSPGQRPGGTAARLELLPDRGLPPAREPRRRPGVRPARRRVTADVRGRGHPLRHPGPGRRDPLRGRVAAGLPVPGRRLRGPPAAGALRRGYNVLAFDRPGQGRNVRDRGLYFRPDWEAVVTPAVDVALARPEVDPERLTLIGMSLGGYLAARAAAFEPRLAAAVLYDGVHDFHRVVAAIGDRAAATPGGLAALMARDTGVRWAVLNGLWTFGVRDFDELLDAARPYTMDGVTGLIACPTLVLEAENDQFFRGQPQRVYDDLTSPTELIVFREDGGAGEHCHEGALSLFHQRTFDWLDTVLGR